MVISIKESTGRIHKIEVELINTIKEIKEKLQLKGIPSQFQRLFHDGRHLEDHNTLNHYNLNSETEIYLDLKGLKFIITIIIFNIT